VEKPNQDISRASFSKVPTPFGQFTAYAYEAGNHSHLALVLGDVEGKRNILTRVHSECLTGDVFSSLRCDCGMQLKKAFAEIEKEGKGVIVYLRGHEGRGIGLGPKVAAYHLQDQGFDTVEANEKLNMPIDARDYKWGAEILKDLKLQSIRLLTNNLEKVKSLTLHGINIEEQIPLISLPHKENLFYLKTKQRKMGHLFDFDSLDLEETKR
jgi:3,4-dihydroxy 2-butanone 4-phosphate synthase / GTP cyclohydrolase II